MKKCLIVLFIFSVMAGGVQAMTIGGAHTELEFSCADCHNVDEPTTAPKMAQCLSCHDSYEALAEATKPAGITEDSDAEEKANPHDSHMGQVNCSDCHKTHKPSVLICEDCHMFDMVPK